MNEEIEPASVIPCSRICPCLVLLVVHQLRRVLRLIELPDRGVDPDLAEQALHPERARFVGHDRHDWLPICLSRSSAARTRTNAIVVEISRSPVPSSWALNVSSGGISSGSRGAAAHRQTAAEPARRSRR